jgi:hypothetical protein
MAVSIFLTSTSSFANEKRILKPFAEHQRLNPGLDAQIKVVSKNIKKNNLKYQIVKFPINGTLYYNGVQISDMGTIVDDPNKVTVDPKDGDTTVTFKYRVIYENGEESEIRTVIMPFKDLKISGAVFHDFDGDGIVDGENISQVEGQQLFVNLVNAKEEVLATKALSKDGTFSFSNSDGIQPNKNYALLLSTQKSSLKAELPATWGYSGESVNSKHKDENKDGIVVVHLKEKNINNIYFGIDLRPTAKSINQTMQLNPGGKVKVAVDKLTGSDSESPNKLRYMITKLPTNATLYENGKQIDKIGVEINKPESLMLDPINGDQKVVFEYVTADVAGVVSHTATVTLPFRGLSISGKLFNDGNANEKIDGNIVSHIENRVMYVTLLDNKRSILASKMLDSNGSYSFNGEEYVVPNEDFYVSLSTEANSTNSTLPKGWNNRTKGVVEVSVGKDNVKDINFSVNQKPTANNIVVEKQLNPGSNLKVVVPTLSATDRESGKKLIYTIVSLPKNAILYSNNKKITEVNTTIEDPSTLSIDPQDAKQGVEFEYVAIDEAKIASNRAKVSMSFDDLKLSGNIFDDGDGDGSVNGNNIYEADKTQLYVFLLDENKKVLANKAVFKDGTFVFTGKDGVRPNAKFSVVLSKSSNENKFALPKGWNYTGESIGEFKDELADGNIVVNAQNSNIENINFGINQKPTAKNQKIAAQLNPGLESQVEVLPLLGDDKESGTNLSYIIKSLPTLGTLYYDGVKISENNFEVEQKDKLTLDPKDGDKIVLFTYVTKDQAGVLSDPARVEMKFTALNISGKVVNDGNGDTKVEGKRLYNPSGVPLYVTLLNENGTPLLSKVLNKDASYNFSGEEFVRPNAYYSIVLSTKAKAKTSLLPQGWANSGEAVNADKNSKDLTVDGIVKVYVNQNNVKNVDFGIDKKPIADNKVVKTQVNPGGTQRVAIPVLSGNDKESGKKLRYMIKSLPNNATLYNNKEKVSKLDIVDPKALTLDPKDGEQSVEFTYVSIDEEGNPSNEATVSLSFSGLKISGEVVNDFIMDGIVNGDLTFSSDTMKLYITLLSKEGDIISSKAIAKDGTYSFDGKDGVNANTSYKLVMSIEQNATKSNLSSGWHYGDGENITSLSKGNDGKADGAIEVNVKDKNVEKVDFSINDLIQ